MEVKGGLWVWKVYEVDFLLYLHKTEQISIVHIKYGIGSYGD